jgi:hypothetical protein
MCTPLVRTLGVLLGVYRERVVDPPSICDHEHVKTRLVTRRTHNVESIVQALIRPLLTERQVYRRSVRSGERYAAPDVRTEDGDGSGRARHAAAVSYSGARRSSNHLCRERYAAAA